jgi:hypothetical protein
MTLLEQIEFDTKEAMKAKAEAKLSTLRMLRSALKNKQIDTDHPMTEDEVLAVVKTTVKQYKDALNDFESAGRTDLAEKQKSEIEQLEAYLPAQMFDADIDAIVKRIVTEQNATQKDMGKLMGVVMKEIAGRADGTRVKEALQRALTV